MAALIPVTINGKEYQVGQDQTILQACEDNHIDIPVMCHLKGLPDVGACRLCLVEVEGITHLVKHFLKKAEGTKHK